MAMRMNLKCMLADRLDKSMKSVWESYFEVDRKVSGQKQSYLLR